MSSTNSFCRVPFIFDKFCVPDPDADNIKHEQLLGPSSVTSFECVYLSDSKVLSAYGLSDGSVHLFTSSSPDSMISSQQQQRRSSSISRRQTPSSTQTQTPTLPATSSTTTAAAAAATTTGTSSSTSPNVGSGGTPLENHQNSNSNNTPPSPTQASSTFSRSQQQHHPFTQFSALSSSVTSLHRSRSPSQKASATLSISNADASPPSRASNLSNEGLDSTDSLPQSIVINEQHSSSLENLVYHPHHRRSLSSDSSIYPLPPCSASASKNIDPFKLYRLASVFFNYHSPIVKLSFTLTCKKLVLIALSQNGVLSKISAHDGKVMHKVNLRNVYPTITCSLKCTSFQLVSNHVIITTQQNTLLSLNLDTFEPMLPLEPPQDANPLFVHDFDGHITLIYADNEMNLYLALYLPFFISLDSSDLQQQCPEPINVGLLPLPKDNSKLVALDHFKRQFLVYSESHVVVFYLTGTDIVPFYKVSSKNIKACKFLDTESIFITHSDSFSIYSYPLSYSTECVELNEENLLWSKQDVTFDTVDVLSFSQEKGSADIIFTSDNGQEVNHIYAVWATTERSTSMETIQNLFSHQSNYTTPNMANATAIVPIGVESLIFGFDTGLLLSYNYSSACSSIDLASIKPQFTCDKRLSSSISLISPIQDPSGHLLIAIGTSTGEAALYTPDLKQLYKYTIFSCPVSNVSRLDARASDLLRDSLAWIAFDGTVCLTSSIDPFELLITIPTSGSTLEKFAIRDNELLLFYEQGKARVWDAQSGELRRSIPRSTGLALLDSENDWVVINLQPEIPDSCVSSFSPGVHTYPPILSINLKKLTDEVTRSLPWKESVHVGSTSPVILQHDNDGNNDVSNNTVSSPKEQRKKEKKLHSLILSNCLALVRFFLSRILPRSLDRHIDNICEANLHLAPALEPPFLGIQKYHDSVTMLYQGITDDSMWKCSNTVTWTRLLTIVTLLGVFLNFPETDRFASEVIGHYALSLHELVGVDFVEPELRQAAMFWLDGSNEIQQSARLIFGSILSRMSVRDISQVIQDLSPLTKYSLNQDTQRYSLLVLGLVATERTNLVTEYVLKDISTMISEYFSQEVTADDYQNKAVAVELCSRGFGIWQNYQDPVGLLESLFALATGKDARTPADLRSAARDASLQVAVINTPLFIGTLTDHLVRTDELSHRDETLRLVAFLVRKRPLVLHAYLPILVEAVVKSLGSNNGIGVTRQPAHEAATMVILNEFVKTYPSVTYNETTQKLAVGTHDGLVNVFDVKGCTKLYVLHGHSHGVTACSFSNDGRRLVTTSLEEQKVLIWKVGYSLLNIFTPGMPPRQGSHGFSEPFKTLDFNVGDEANMTTAATLEWARFEWQTDRTVTLRIRESALTFSVT